MHRRVVAAGDDEDQQVAALLHDVLEDIAATEDDLRGQGFSDQALHVVRLMTKRADVPQEGYLFRLAARRRTPAVQLCHIASNTDRVAQVEPAVRQRLLTEYTYDLRALGEDPSRLDTGQP